MLLLFLQDKAPSEGLSLTNAVCYVLGVLSIVPAIALPGAIAISGENVKF